MPGRELTEAAVAVTVVLAATVAASLGVVSGDAAVGVWGTVLGYVFRGPLSKAGR